MAIRSEKYFTREPLEGMVVVCDLPITTGNSWGLWEHSGIYVGNGKIVSFDLTNHQ